MLPFQRFIFMIDISTPWIIIPYQAVDDRIDEAIGAFNGRVLPQCDTGRCQHNDLDGDTRITATESGMFKRRCGY